MNNRTGKILVVDDEPYIGEIVARWLHAEGYLCATACSRSNPGSPTFKDAEFPAPRTIFLTEVS